MGAALSAKRAPRQTACHGSAIEARAGVEPVLMRDDGRLFERTQVFEDQRRVIGADDFVAKPFQPSRVLEAARRVLG